MDLAITQLAPTFGAEVQSIDLSIPPDSETIESIKALWAKNQILLFRNQFLEEEDLVRFSAALGKLEIHVRHEFLSPDHPEVLFISNIIEKGRPIGILSDTEVGWHIDQIYLSRPATGSLLYSVKLPSNGGQTSFADMTAAYEALPDEIKTKLDSRRAVQSYEAFNAQYSVPTDNEQKKKTPKVDQPVVRTHPISGRKALYLCPGMTTRIIGMAENESQELLDFLFDWTVKPEFIYTHDWVLGDAILWDNASTMHRREPFDGEEQRLMKRTTILPPEEFAVPV